MPDNVVALRDKYRQMRHMRELDAAGASPDPRREMAELARRFPGALRELDELPMHEIERRLSVLESVIDAGSSAPDWVRLQIGYHGLMRAALRIKRWFSRGEPGDADALLLELAVRYVPAADEPPLASFDHAALRAILEPADGRLNPWVFARVAEACGVDPATVRDALFWRRA